MLYEQSLLQGRRQHAECRPAPAPMLPCRLPPPRRRLLSNSRASRAKGTPPPPRRRRSNGARGMPTCPRRLYPRRACGLDKASCRPRPGASFPTPNVDGAFLMPPAPGADDRIGHADLPPPSRRRRSSSNCRPPPGAAFGMRPMHSNGRPAPAPPSLFRLRLEHAPCWPGRGARSGIGLRSGHPDCRPRRGALFRTRPGHSHGRPRPAPTDRRDGGGRHVACGVVGHMHVDRGETHAQPAAPTLPSRMPAPARRRRPIPRANAAPAPAPRLHSPPEWPARPGAAARFLRGLLARPSASFRARPEHADCRPRCGAAFSTRPANAGCRPAPTLPSPLRP